MPHMDNLEDELQQVESLADAPKEDNLAECEEDGPADQHNAGQEEEIQGGIGEIECQSSPVFNINC